MTYVFATEQPLVCKHLTKWKVNKHGYDSIGSYWGAVLQDGKVLPVWTFDLYFQTTDNKFHVDNTVRARTKTEAKKKIKQRFPNIKKFILD